MLDSDGTRDIEYYNLLFKSVKDEESCLSIGSRKIIFEQGE